MGVAVTRQIENRKVFTSLEVFTLLDSQTKDACMSMDLKNAMAILIG